MAFLGQFNLAETAPYDPEGALPTRGLLSFFYETDGEPLYAELWGRPQPQRPEDYPQAADPRSWRVLYVPEDPSTFSRRVTPASVNAGGRFPNCAVRFTTEWTVPDADGPELRPLGLDPAERFALTELEADINRGTWDDPGIRLLGYPFNMDGSTLVECDFAARGLHDVLWHRMTPGQRVELERDAARRWRLLLQLTGGEAFPRNWGGNGRLHCCIERTALVARDFSRAWINLQFV